MKPYPNEELDRMSKREIIRLYKRTVEQFSDAVPVIRCKDCALWDDADSEHLVGYCTEGDGEKITFRNEWCCWAERKDVYVTLHHDDIHFKDEESEKAFYNALAERKEE